MPPPSPKIITKKTKITIDDKFTFYHPPSPRLFLHCYPNGFCIIPWIDSFQLPIFISKSPLSCHFRHRQKPQKNPKITIDDKVTFCCFPDPEASLTDPNNNSARSPGSTVSDSPDLLRNSNQYFNISFNTKTPQKNTKIDNKINFYYNPDTDVFSTVSPKAFAQYPGSKVSNPP